MNGAKDVLAIIIIDITRIAISRTVLHTLRTAQSINLLFIASFTHLNGKHSRKEIKRNGSIRTLEESTPVKKVPILNIPIMKDPAFLNEVDLNTIHKKFTISKEYTCPMK